MGPANPLALVGKNDASRSWSRLQIHVPKNAQALFNFAVKTIVGNGMPTKFWADWWLQGKTVAELVPNLFQFIPKRTVNRCTIAQALNNRSWVADIEGALPVPSVDRTSTHLGPGGRDDLAT